MTRCKCRCMGCHLVGEPFNDPPKTGISFFGAASPRKVPRRGFRYIQRKRTTKGMLGSEAIVYRTSCGVIPARPFPVVQNSLVVEQLKEMNAGQIRNTDADSLVMIVEPDNIWTDGQRVWFALSASPGAPTPLCLLFLAALRMTVGGAAAAPHPNPPRGERGSSTNIPNNTPAPRLSSGSLLLPHLGDWTQEGQPSSQGHSLSMARVACQRSRRMS